MTLLEIMINSFEAFHSTFLHISVIATFYKGTYKLFASQEQTLVSMSIKHVVANFQF